jgi:hypothetical protein
MAKFKKEWSYTSNPSGTPFIGWDGWIYSLRKSVQYLIYRDLGGPGDCGEQTVVNRQTVSTLTEITARIFGHSARSMITILTELHVYEV